MAERARLEIECTPKAYRGFKSPSLRCFQIIILARVVKLVDTYDSGSYGTTAVRVRVPSRAPFIEFFFYKRPRSCLRTKAFFISSILSLSKFGILVNQS